MYLMCWLLCCASTERQVGQEWKYQSSSSIWVSSASGAVNFLSVTNGGMVWTQTIVECLFSLSSIWTVPGLYQDHTGSVHITAKSPHSHHWLVTDPDVSYTQTVTDCSVCSWTIKGQSWHISTHPRVFANPLSYVREVSVTIETAAYINWCCFNFQHSFENNHQEGR